jgi:hypothetical protein
MLEEHFDEPQPILAAAHRVRGRIPCIEIAHQVNRFCRRGDTIEIGRPDRSFCHERIGGARFKYSFHGLRVANADVDCGRPAVPVRSRFRIWVSGLLNATPTEDCVNECRRVRTCMNCSKTSRSAWSQSFRGVPWRHPPAHQSSRARRSICSWTPRWSVDVKPTIRFSSDFLIERFFMEHFMGGWKCDHPRCQE